MTRSGNGRRSGIARRSLAIPAPGRDWAYFFDIDGTLVDLADAPAGVHLDHGLGELIEGLYRSAGGAVALISGRSLADIDRLFPGIRLPAAGQHGIERRDASGRLSRHAFPSQRLDWVHDRLADAVAQHPGLLLEHKGLSLALHYRRAPRLGGFAHRLVRSLLTRLGAQYCVQTGKRVVEMKPAGKDKGSAILEFMQEKPFRGRTPVFVGDDSTDEYGFATVNRLHGHAVKVGPGRTAARWRLRDVGAVRAWLERAMAPPGGGSGRRTEAPP
ncbi:MAG: trehalose-phosphatase [Gemmatimonadales bacterium]